MTGEWIKNPDYGNSGFTVELECGDRILVAIPLHEDYGGGYDIQLIIPTETGFDDPHHDSWDTWSWDDVEYYSKVNNPIDK